jgi:hypothetical protein
MVIRCYRASSYVVGHKLHEPACDDGHGHGAVRDSLGYDELLLSFRCTFSSYYWLHFVYLI